LTHERPNDLRLIERRNENGCAGLKVVQTVKATLGRVWQVS
jgi:hypothetical protein